MNDLSLANMNADLASQEKLVQAWRQTYATPSFPCPELIETHISWILLTKDKAYKIKKALRLDFLDFSCLASRRFYCEEEIRLNKRTAPEIYQRVVSLGGNPAAPRINAEPVLEYAVEMRRFSGKNEMARMLKENRLQPFHIDSLARNIARFHESLSSAAGESSHAAYGTYALIFHGLKNNYDALTAIFSSRRPPLARRKFKALRSRHFAVLEEKKEIIEARRKKGFVRECHGDLHTGNIIFVNDEAILFDHIEFAPDFRCIDVINDLAFAFADLHYFGRPDYAWRLLSRYLEETGDYEGVGLLNVFAASHALVRAKVAAIRHFQVNDRTQKAASLKESRRYFFLARDLLRTQSAGLVITCGLPGAGKSLFSLAALARSGAIRIRSDVERKRYYGLKSQQDSAGAGINIYDEKASEITYDILEKQADMLIGSGFRVIVDAAFLRQPEREKFRRLAVSRSVPYVIVMISASYETLFRRVTARQMRHDDPSEAGPGVLAKKQLAFEPLLPGETEHVIEIINEDGHDFESGEADWEKLEQKLRGS